MTPERELGAILDETVKALSTFDVDGLLLLVDRANAVCSEDFSCAELLAEAVARKRQVLAATLASTELNIRVLRRLGSRMDADRMEPWEH
jgi:phosphosulfolactate phosphohydrolase-like enzyme